MVAQSFNYEGSLRCVAKHGPSGVTLATDAPTDNMGRGESFSPTDLVVTALATCKLTTMAIFAERHQVKLDGSTAYAVTVFGLPLREKHMTTSGLRKIERIVVRIDFCKGIAADMRPKLENAARSCPVAKSLAPEVEQEVSFKYPD